MKNAQILQFTKEVDGKRMTATFEDGTQLGVAYDFSRELANYFSAGIQKQCEKAQNQPPKEEENGKD